jgi:hypothetical protein
MIICIVYLNVFSCSVTSYIKQIVFFSIFFFGSNNSHLLRIAIANLNDKIVSHVINTKKNSPKIENISSALKMEAGNPITQICFVLTRVRYFPKSVSNYS